MVEECLRRPGASQKLSPLPLAVIASHSNHVLALHIVQIIPFDKALPFLPKGVSSGG